MPALKPEIALGKHFKATATIATPSGSRIFAGYAPQEAADPFIILRRGGTDVDHKQAGNSGMKTVSIDVWITGKNYEVITDIAEAIETEMYANVHRGTITEGAKSITFRKAYLQDQVDEQEVIDDATGKPIRRVYQRWECTYQN